MIRLKPLEANIDSRTNILRIIAEDSRSIRAHLHSKLGGQKDLVLTKQALRVETPGNQHHRAFQSFETICQ